MAHLLEVRGLRVAYARVPALHGVDLVVPEHGVAALLGPNGAGKSTLLKAVAGVLRPEGGRILLQGRPLDGLAAHERARLGICLVPEGRGIFPSLTVEDNLRVALGGGASRPNRVIDHFPILGKRARQVAGTLSGGEQQMLALARAVAAEPVLLLADELSFGLAPRLVQTMADMLRALHEQAGRTILLVEQHATHALRLADVVYILGQGRVVWSGEPGELRASKVLAQTYLGGTV